MTIDLREGRETGSALNATLDQRLPSNLQMPPGSTVRILPTPRLGPRDSTAADTITQVRIEKPGALPVEAVVRRSALTPEFLVQLEGYIQDLPRLWMGPRQGAVDIRLEDPDGNQVKSGVVVLTGPGGDVSAILDPVSRRFRVDGLVPGTYQIRAASAGQGRASQSLLVRDGDVTRAIARLDGSTPVGTATLNVAVSGAASQILQVRATDRNTGLLVFNGSVSLHQGAITLDHMPISRIHFDVLDDTGASGCYDVDLGSRDVIHDLVHEVALEPPLINRPDPPDDRFAGLGPQYAALRSLLPSLGIHSVDDLAAVEGEDLMHRSRTVPAVQNIPVSSSLLGAAIEQARSLRGLAFTSGEARNALRLAGGAAFRRLYLPRAAGRADLDVTLPAGSHAELLLERPAGVERRTLSGSQRISLDIGAAEIASGNPFQLSLTNLSSGALFGEVRATLPIDALLGEIAHVIPTTRDNIETVYAALARTNPGIATTIVESSLVPENIRAWLDRARAFFAEAGVCSINDLGRFRIEPNRVLRPGLYVAPVKPPVDISHVLAVPSYAFSEILSGSVLHYRPNDLIHDTAVVLAGTWDITNQPVVLAPEVRDFFVIARSITFNNTSLITWLPPDLPTPLTYFPNPAANGANGSVPGERGHDAEPGDGDPHPARNGGPDAATRGPILTMYILDATNGLPRILLGGQTGGPGGLGQDGGHGGDGAQGVNADSTLLGCCRAVGWGGDGGTGGAGGRGGQGGRGGPGGAITLLTSEASIAVLADQTPDIEVNGGDGGPGGFPGNPGGGGHAGPAGSADCQFWCPSHPERHGNDGATGALGQLGRTGDRGPDAFSDAVQIYPITDQQWNEVFNSPHILQVTPLDVEPGENVTIRGQNFIPGTDKIFFDGKQLPDASAQVSTSTTAAFQVPLDAEGGTHPVVIHPVPATSRRSNRVSVRVIPKIESTQFPFEKRWNETDVITINGWAIEAGCQVVAEDWSVTPHPAFSLPVVGTTTRTTVTVQIPPGPLGAMRGVRRIFIRNPDGGVSRPEHIVRISDTIIVNVAAWRVLGTLGGGTQRSVADIVNLFAEGAANSLSLIWQQARVVFRLVEPVGTVTVNEDEATIWPHSGDVSTDSAHDIKFLSGVARSEQSKSALNVFIVRDIQNASGYSWIGTGLLFCGLDQLNLGESQHVTAHEVGHAMCLHHFCAKDKEEDPQTQTGRKCGEPGDPSNVMYPNFPPGDLLLPEQIDTARSGALHFEQGKTQVSLDGISLSMCGFKDQG